MSVTVRFAPSPTGYLHVGNGRPALLNWLFARKLGGRFILRFDDTDTTRGTQEFADAIETDLKWLGLDWDESFRQSDRTALYAAAAEKLKASGRLYPCFESEAELQAKRDYRVKRGQPPVYDRAMLNLTAEQREKAEAGGKTPYWRFKLSNYSISWPDLVLGKREVKLPAVSDPVLIRADGSFLYTFTSVVDDLDCKITHILRGEDHITNTGVQLDIIEALGGNRSRLSFAHFPMITAGDGSKLSKRTDSISLRSLRADGVEPVAITAYLATLGSSADPVLLPPLELAKSFDFTKFSASPAKFDIGQVLALNRKLLHTMPFADAVSRLPPGATEAFWLAVRGNLDLLSEARGYWDVVAGQIIPPVIEGESAFLTQALALLPQEPWDDAVWNVWTDAIKADTGRKGKSLFMPLRLALTGEDHGPELKALLPLMGRARTAQRLAVAAS
jgi:glutamyl-tRNA synthetase